MPEHRTVVAAVAALGVVVLLGSFVAGMSRADSVASMHPAEQDDGNCMTTAHCASAPDCLSHCSTVIHEGAPDTHAPAVTPARTGIEAPILQAVAVDLQKPPPRVV